MNVANLLPNAPLRSLSDLAMTQQSLAEWWVGGEVTHRIANPPFLSTESSGPVATAPRTNRKRIVNVATAAFLALAPAAHAGGYVAPVTEIIMPVDMPAAPGINGAWIVGGVVALGVLCALLCGGDGETVTQPDEPDTPAPVPLLPAWVLLVSGLAGLGAVNRGRR